MGRPKKPIRLHKFEHRDNWYIRQSGKPDKSAGSPCLGRALTAMRNHLSRIESETPPAPIDTKPRLMSAVRKIVRKSRERAKVKRLPFELSEADILKLIEPQNGRCALTGIEFSVSESSEGRRLPFAPSADRLDNAKGYTPDNIRIVCVIANLARGDFSDAEFIAMCKGVAALHGD